MLSTLVRGYQLVIRPWLPPLCRYQPTCSAFALEALQLHGPVKGSILAGARICRCHPLHAGGYDPVPPARPEVPRHSRRRTALARGGPLNSRQHR